MIKAKLNNGDLVFGLSRENIDRLQKGEPIVFNLSKIGLESRNVMIVFGETENDIYKDMLPHIDLDKTKINFEEKYRMIEGVYIEEKWMRYSDFPEPPDEKEVPSLESKNQWDMYRNALEKFSIKYKLQ